MRYIHIYIHTYIHTSKHTFVTFCLTSCAPSVSVAPTTHKLMLTLFTFISLSSLLNASKNPCNACLDALYAAVFAIPV